MIINVQNMNHISENYTDGNPDDMFHNNPDDMLDSNIGDMLDSNQEEVHDRDPDETHDGDSEEVNDGNIDEMSEKNSEGIVDQEKIDRIIDDIEKFFNRNFEEKNKAKFKAEQEEKKSHERAQPIPENQDEKSEFLQRIAQRSRDCRIWKNLSQKELAEFSCISVASIRKFEETGQISLYSLLKIVFVLGNADGLLTVFDVPTSFYDDRFEKINNPRNRKRRKPF
jgi:hypothetical protein